MDVDYVSLGNIIIDDIVLPSGETHMNTLGGGGTHAIVGMRVWTDRLGFVATVGPDFDPAHRAILASYGMDLSGIITRSGQPTARAWQIFEPDERRIEIFRTSEEAFECTKPTFEEMPPHYLRARGFHLLWGTLEELLDLVGRLRAANGDLILLWEPSPAHIEGDRDLIRALLQRVDIVSPNYDEAARMTGQDGVETILEELLAWGASVVGLRLGAEGSAVAAREDGGIWKIPAVPPAVFVDVTGAGNAYCGGFLVGYGETGNPFIASLYAAVSASFALEQFGIPHIDGAVGREARRRLEELRHQVRRASDEHHVAVISDQ